MVALEEQLVPIVGTIFGCSIAIIVIYTDHKRDMALIEKGLYKHTPMELTKKVLLAGLILVAIGTAVFLGIYWEVGLGAWTIAGLLPCFIGIALLISYPSIRKKDEEGSGMNFGC